MERLIASGQMREAHRHDLDVVLRNARTLHKHVDDLLDAARLEAGKLKLDYAETDVAQLVRVAAANFDGLAAERGISFSVEAPPSLQGQVDPDNSRESF